MPYYQYRKDGRTWKGFQKGADSLKKHTLLALLDLLKGLLNSIQVSVLRLDSLCLAWLFVCVCLQLSQYKHYWSFFLF